MPLDSSKGCPAVVDAPGQANSVTTSANSADRYQRALNDTAINTRQVLLADTA